MARLRHPKGGPPPPNSPPPPPPVRFGLNQHYTYTRRKWRVRSVEAWRLNRRTQELEWCVLWWNGTMTWEPNCNANGYSLAIYHFLSDNEDLPPTFDGE
eukprot:3692323-Rhodomonas_salina.1